MREHKSFGPLTPSKRSVFSLTPLCFWSPAARNVIGKKSGWGKQELKKKGKEALGMRNNRKRTLVRNEQKWDLVSDKDAPSRCLRQSGAGFPPSKHNTQLFLFPL